jgi:hypothetical protein
MSRSNLYLAVLASAALLGGCLFDTKVAGGAEDFPNTIASLGMTASQNLGEHSEWDQFSNISAVDLSGADPLVVAPRAKASGTGAPLAKATSGNPADSCVGRTDTTYDLSDTATLRIGRRFLKTETSLCHETDTTVFRWDDKADDGIPGNELRLESRGGLLRILTRVLRAYRFENTDSTGGFDRATFYERDQKPSGMVHHKLHVVKPGPDGDFAAKADNRPVYYASARTLAGDTLDAFDVSDADGDGELWGAGDSGLVHVRALQTEPVLRPSVARFTQALRAMSFRQSGKTYPVAYHEVRTDRNGRSVSFTLAGPRKDSAFGPGDTVWVSVVTVTGPEEEARFSRKASRFQVELSPDPGAFSRNRLLKYVMETTWKPGAFRKGLITATRLTFIPATPVSSGTLPIEGTLLLEAEFADGNRGSATGHLKDRRIRVDLDELKDGQRLRRFRILWDAADGRVLEQSRLPD